MKIFIPNIVGVRRGRLQFYFDGDIDVRYLDLDAFVKSLDIISLIYKAHSKEYSLSFDDSSVAHVHILPDHVIAEL